MASDRANPRRLGVRGPALDLDRMRALLLSVAVWVWCASVSYPLLSFESVRVGELRTMDQTSSSMLLYQALGWFGYVAVVAAFYLPRCIDVWRRYDAFQYVVCAILFLSFFLQLQGEPSRIQVGILYTVMLLVTFGAMSVIWSLTAEEIDRLFAGAAIVLCSFGVTAVAIHGIPEDRNVGGMIQPNLFATPLLAAFILSQFSRSWIMWVVRVISLLLVAAVSSRFAIVGCVIAFVIFETTYKPVSVRVLVLVSAGTIALLIMADRIVDVLALDDPTRNLDSGLTGRDDEWAVAAQHLVEYPFGIGFKRPQPADMGHNGYIKTMLEFGVIGGPVIIAAVLSIVVRALGAAVMDREGGETLRRFRSARAGGLLALSFASFFQPQLLNLGDGGAIAFLAMLFVPAGVLSGRGSVLSRDS